MEILKIILLVLLAITSLLLTLLILLHKGRGGGMTSSLGSSGVAEKNLNRFTVALALSWGLVIVALGLIQRFAGES